MADSSQDNVPVSKIVIWGAGIAVASIALFGGIWLGLGQLGTGDAVRLVLAVCTPPLLMTVASIGLYLRRRDSV